MARGGLANLVGAVLAATAGMGVTWLVARGLGPTSAGAFFAATAGFVLVGGVARLGTLTAMVYWPARLRAQGRPELIGACLRAGLVPVAILGSTLGIALWVVAPWVAPDYAAPLRALALFTPVAALGDALLAATRGYRMMRPTVLLDKIARPALQLAGVGALAAVTTVSTIAVPAQTWALAWVLPSLPVLVTVGWLVWRRWRTEPRSAAGGQPTDRTIDGVSVPRAFWRFTAPRAFANTAQTALQRVDVLMIAAMAGLAPAAGYAVAGRFVVVGQLANGSIAQAVQPRLAEALAVGDQRGAARLYQTATAWLILTAWPLHLLVASHADLYLRVFGPSYVSAVNAVRVLAGAMLLATGCGMVDMVLSMAGKTTWNLVNVLIALVAMIAVDLVAIPHWGALGAACGLATAVTVNNLLPLAQLSIALRLHPFGAATRTAMALALASFGLVPWLVDHALSARSLDWLPSDPSSLAARVLGVLAGVAVYLAGLHRLRHRLGLDRQLLRRNPSVPAAGATIVEEEARHAN